MPDRGGFVEMRSVLHSGAYMGAMVTPNSLFMGAKWALILWRE
jgi:hypothetical protein